MIPTFVHDLPKGDEKGDFLALDLGGRCVCVCSVCVCVCVCVCSVFQVFKIATKREQEGRKANA